MTHRWAPIAVVGGLAGLVLAMAPAAGAGTGHPAARLAAAAGTVPRPDHTVVVVMENHSYSSIIGSSSAPYLNSLAAGGASFTQSFGVTHPSEPNYLALFSGSTQGLTDDSCPHTYTTQNLGSELITASLTFKGYSETMPSNGYTGCTSGSYARKHNPWVNFTSNVPAASNLTFASFPTTYTSLPTVSFVVPNLNDDMHDGTIAAGDTWVKNNINGYAQWAKTHNSLLVVTWDEDDSSSNNQVPTIFYGAPVKTGSYSETINHYNVLRTIEQAYGLPYAGASSTATPITDAWTIAAGNTVTVTNPGSQTGTVGTAKSLQIQATDSASGQSLTYSATGLPPGLSINSATGLISGTPTTAGTYSVTITVTDGTGASGSASFSWTVSTSSGGCSSPGQKIVNPGFETGTAAPWTASSGVVSNSTSEPPHAGSWDAWLDGYGTTTTDTLSQTFTIPAGCTATLSFYLHIDTAETGTTAYDKLTVKANSTTLATYSNVNAGAGYQQKSFNISSFAGQTVTITFTGSEDSSQQTSFVIDDVTVTLS